VIAPASPVFHTRWRCVVGIAGDLVAATLLVWAVPLAFGVVVALIRAASVLFGR
jgi:hypothetical protein